MRISSIVKAGVVAVAAVIAIAPSAVAYDLTGAGATSVSTFLEKCKTDYQADTKDTLSYAGGGSGTGKTAINAGTKDLAFSDSVNTAAPTGVFHIPAAVWPVGIAYNLNNSASNPIQLSAVTIAKIFAGTITKWNDPSIVADVTRVRSIPVYAMKNGIVVKNEDGSPKVLKFRTQTIRQTMPNRSIVVIYRGSTSGTTNNFTSALAALAPTVWTKGGNDSFTVANPLDVSTRAGSFQAGTGSQGVADLLQRTKDSIGYVETGFIGGTVSPAVKRAQVINNAGKTVEADVTGAQAQFAASDLNEATGLVAWAYTSKAEAAYPFTAATYAMVKSNYGVATLSAAVKRQVEYMAFNCSTSVTTEGMIPVTKTSDLGKAILKLTAKIG